MHIGYVPREIPPFSALNLRSGAYNFHKFPKIRSGASPFYIFCRIGDHNFQNFFNFNPFIASHGQLSRQRRGLARRVLAVPETPIFTLKRFKLVPEPRIFKLKTAQARSGAPHFHAQLGARSGALAHFSFCRGTYLPKLGVSTPPPRDRGNVAAFARQRNDACCCVFIAFVVGQFVNLVGCRVDHYRNQGGRKWTRTSGQVSL